jgi:PKD repeat protein
LANPTITYNTAGVYNVSLTVTDASGSVSATKNSYITVNPSSAMFTGAAFAESFEGAAIPTSDWRVRNINTGTNTWTQTSAAASLGTKSVRVLNTATSVGQIDELLSPSIDMTQITGTSPQMTFKVANAQRTSADIDKLQVYVSTNCGKNWVLRKSVQGTALASGGVVTSSYTPAAADWTLQTVNLSAYATHTNLYIMFRFISGGGNNVYVDEINLFGNTVGIDEFTSSLNFSVFPNPTTENTTIAFDLTEKQNVNVMVYDIVGKEIVTVVNTELAPGEYKYEMNKNTKLAPGVYFVKLTAGTHTITKKLIVE